MEPNTPVTEAEMSGFFARVTTTFVGLSRQAQELGELSQRFTAMQGELQQVRDTNSRLLSERDAEIETRLRTEQERDDVRKHRDHLNERVGMLNEIIVRRDTAVNDLESQLHSAKLAHEDEQREHEVTKTRFSATYSDLESTRHFRDHWHDRAEKAEAELLETKAKLQKVVDQMNSLGDILGIVKAKEPEVVKEATAEVKAEEVPVPQSDPTKAGDTGQLSLQSEADSSKTAEQPARPWWETPVREQNVG